MHPRDQLHDIDQHAGFAAFKALSLALNAKATKKPSTQLVVKAPLNAKLIWLKEWRNPPTESDVYIETHSNKDCRKALHQIPEGYIGCNNEFPDEILHQKPVTLIRDVRSPAEFSML
ncbi:hypothetical protein MKW98_028369 [Papaver atlanticum]|uniref:Uncharacterized protein n=1 Tax=Papaver atlanticum TaxID=357466 RepID=A0AAD4SXS2_9MAGN|nr:hypothetical protein MKW98_028369 [Papaver atlanticum]